MCCLTVVFFLLTVASSPVWTLTETPIGTLPPGDELPPGDGLPPGDDPLESTNLDSKQNGEIGDGQEEEPTKYKITAHNRVKRENENIFFFPPDRKLGNYFETLGLPEIPVKKQNVGYPPYGVNGNFGPQYPMYTYPHRYPFYPSSAYAGNGGTYGYSGLGFQPWFSGNNYPFQGRYPNPSEYEVISEKPVRKARSSEEEDQPTNPPEQITSTTETADVSAFVSIDKKRNYFTRRRLMQNKNVKENNEVMYKSLDEVETTEETGTSTTEKELP